MATWPSTLPAPRVSGYGVNPVDMTIRTEMESGSTRARRRSVARKDNVPLAWLFTAEQFATFRDWYDDADGADGGAGWFSIDLYVGDAAGKITVTARFAEVWQSAPVGSAKLWAVTAKLEIRYA